MFQISSQVYLDKYNECYKKIIVIKPEPKDDILKKITKKIHTEKLSPFKDRSPCCPEDKCLNVVCYPDKNKCNCDIMCVEDIHILFDYLLKNGYKINTDVTKIMQKSDVKIKNLICYISK
jgi:hypothetical protein